jgi:isovaleryl-CoA dehydrogenase
LNADRGSQATLGRPDFELPGLHRAALDAASEFTERELSPIAGQIDAEDRFPEWLWSRLAEVGFLGAAIPERWGGSGGDLLTAAVIVQAMARGVPAVAMSYGAHTNLCAHNLLRNGNDEQRGHYLPKLCSGEFIGGLALTEPGAGSDAVGIQLRARKVEGGHRLTGTKIFITNGSIADLLIVYGKTDPDAGGRGITAFLVEPKTMGVRVDSVLEKMGMHGSPTAVLGFDEVFVPAENVLGEVNTGLRVMMGGLDVERAYFAALCVGVAEQALKHTLEYANTREQFGRKIGEFQLVQGRIADSYTMIEAARLLAYRAASIVEDRRASTESAAALLLAAETAQLATNNAVQIFGGYGYMRESPVERLFRDARLLTIGAGTSEVRRTLIARELLHLR